MGSFYPAVRLLSGNKMEKWDLVKIYGRAMRSEHYIEALSVGYQLIEFILEFVLTTQPVGKDNATISKSKVRKSKYLIQKAKLALENEFITQDIFDEIDEFNKLRKDIIHNLVENNVDGADIVKCANMVGDVYYSIQQTFLGGGEIGEWKEA